MLAALLLPAVVFQSVELKVTQSGKDLGTAFVSHRILANGGKHVSTRLELKSPGREVTVRQEASYDSEGRPTRKLQQVLENGKMRQNVLATFDERGAQVVAGGKSTRVSLVAGAPRALKSEFWFLRDAPTIGASVRAYSFDLTRREWRLTDVRYHRKTAAGHEVESEMDGRTTVSVLDARGLPIRIDESGGMRLERVNPTAG